jgi:hypothetical protein
MNTPKSSDDVMRELNELAQAQGRYLGLAFWEIPREPGSIVDVPVTPEAEERIRRLDARIARLKRQRAADRGPEGQRAGRSNARDLTSASPFSEPSDAPPAEEPLGH